MRESFWGLMGIALVFFGVGGMYFLLGFFLPLGMERPDDPFLVPVGGFLMAFPCLAIILGIVVLGEFSYGSSIALGTSGFALIVFGGLVAGHFLEANIVGGIYIVLAATFATKLLTKKHIQKRQTIDRSKI